MAEIIITYMTKRLSHTDINEEGPSTGYPKTVQSIFFRYLNIWQYSNVITLYL